MSKNRNHETRRCLLTAFRCLNNRLADCEASLRHQVIQMNKDLLDKVRGGDPFLHDYCIEVTISVILDKSDRAWRKDSDNVISSVTFFANFYPPYARQDGDWKRLADSKNHNPLKGWEAYPLRNEPHCFLLSKLMMSEGDLLIKKLHTVGSIHVDINVTHEHVLTIKGKKFQSRKRHWKEINLKDFM